MRRIDCSPEATGSGQRVGVKDHAAILAHTAHLSGLCVLADGVLGSALFPGETRSLFLFDENLARSTGVADRPPASRIDRLPMVRELPLGAAEVVCDLRAERVPRDSIHHRLVAT
jgi:hypothetical protein